MINLVSKIDLIESMQGALRWDEKKKIIYRWWWQFVWLMKNLVHPTPKYSPPYCLTSDVLDMY